jgi:hypothetical protein
MEKSLPAKRGSASSLAMAALQVEAGTVTVASA